MKRKSNIPFKASQVEILKRLPSKLFAAASVRSGAGVHADQSGRYGKRDRAKVRAEERRAYLAGE